ncbi:ribonuclease III [Allochromatium vinosum]|uniref:Ribonuclease 3 n=1 Tax=Allochromatium vinosum (strain ATCC 17899 / DSM 180 / NBRC 103801 / NCIMB 10441 / D) TaxID=572477 RepID=D3RTZ1_ALLVD|nr:ribonuclease III [Allochromatium vinosum]ADC62650.1 ribonuclease III [Allochromatium vinosum DSM 180]
MNADPRRLAQALGHRFTREELLIQALTHRSVGSSNNERLEFLGDALIGFVIAEALWERFPKADEGTLSRMRASLVKRESLARLARDLKLGDSLRLGAGELRTGGHARDSILADALEAVLGAVYLDAGFERTRTVVLELFAARLEQTDAERAGKDPKTRLQEWLQSYKRPLPEYLVLSIDGDQHDQTFIVSCQLQDADVTTRGTGTSRRRAEQAAAESMLERIQHG